MFTYSSRYFCSFWKSSFGVNNRKQSFFLQRQRRPKIFRKHVSELMASPWLFKARFRLGLATGGGSGIKLHPSPSLSDSTATLPTGILPDHICHSITQLPLKKWLIKSTGVINYMLKLDSQYWCVLMAHEILKSYSWNNGKETCTDLHLVMMSWEPKDCKVNQPPGLQKLFCNTLCSRLTWRWELISFSLFELQGSGISHLYGPASQPQQSKLTQRFLWEVLNLPLF